MAVRETSNIIGMGSAERHWVDVKLINSGKLSHISSDDTDKKSMIYTKFSINKEKFHRDELAKLNDACADWGDEEEKFNLGI